MWNIKRKKRILHDGGRCGTSDSPWHRREREKKKSRADKRALSGCWLCAWVCVYVWVCMLGQIFNTYFLNDRRNKWQRKKRFSMSKEYQARLSKFIACSICLNASNNEIMQKWYFALSLLYTHTHTYSLTVLTHGRWLDSIMDRMTTYRTSMPTLLSV